jgi:hypothetical protein
MPKATTETIRAPEMKWGRDSTTGEINHKYGV